MTPTEELLLNGGFTLRPHPGLKGDIQEAEKNDPGSWFDMKAVLLRVQAGTAREHDFKVPLASVGIDVGELRNTRGPYRYRLYVHAERGSSELQLLLFDRKPAGPGGLILQNQHIVTACARLLNWPS